MGPGDAVRPEPEPEPEPDRVPLTGRLDRFQRAHPELRIVAPWATRSGLREVSVPGKADTTQYDNEHRMLDTLEARYPETTPRSEGSLRAGLP
jgi:hypothetical protein